MAVFTVPDAADRARLLRDYALGDLIAWDGIAGGIENSNFFVTTTRGEFVLTLFERLNAEQLPYYLELMRHLARQGLPVPEPRPNADGTFFSVVKDKPAAIVNRLPGASVENAAETHCAQAGAFLARMHLAGADYPRFQPNLRGLDWWQQVLPALRPFLDSERFDLLADEVRQQDRFARTPDFEKLPAGPLHADLFRDNVLFAGAGAQARIGGVIDFYFACNGPFLFDVAVAVNDWCVDIHDGRLDAARARAAARLSRSAAVQRRRTNLLAHGSARGGVAILGIAPVRSALPARGPIARAARSRPLRDHAAPPPRRHRAAVALTADMPHAAARC
jgi:homoserine kinase type II